MKKMVLFNVSSVCYFLQTAKEILEINPDMHVKGQYSINKRISGLEQCHLFEFLTTETTLVRLSQVVQYIEDGLKNDTIMNNDKVWLYK